MDIKRESSMVNIKNKMTQIRREKKGPVLQNYYLNCEKDDEIFAIYGEDSVVFWVNDIGVVRVYFYSTVPDELIILLKQAPKGAIIDYITRNKGENEELFVAAGYKLDREMIRMQSNTLTAEEIQALEKKSKLLDARLFMRDRVRAATEEDCDEVFNKMYEVFDVRESHLCSREKLLEYIRNRWVAVYYENGEMVGFFIFTIENNHQLYTYLLWNGTGPEGYYSLKRMVDQLYAEQIRDVPRSKIRQSYGWMNAKNRKMGRLNQFWGLSKFDGLYDFVYEKQ